MVPLNLYELNKIRTPDRWEVLYNKIREGKEFECIDGSKVIINALSIWCKSDIDHKLFEKYYFHSTDENSENLKTSLLFALNLRCSYPYMVYVIVECKCGKIFTITKKKSNLVKTTEFGAVGTFGELAEGILGSAMVASIKNYPKTIDKTDIIEVMKETSLLPGNTLKVNKINSNLVFNLNLTKTDMEKYKDFSKYSSYETYMDNCVKYVNSVYFCIKPIYDKLTVNVIGPTRTKKDKNRKVDIEVLANDTIPIKKISLKTTSKLLGQVYGSDYNTVNDNLFKKFGVDLFKNNTSLIPTVKIFKPDWLYCLVVSLMSDMIKEDPLKFLENILWGLDYFSTNTEPNVDLVTINNYEVSLNKIEHLEKSISKISGMYCRFSPDNLIHIGLYTNVPKYEEGILFKIRCKQEKDNVIRHYIEKGPLFDALGSIKL